MSSGKVHDKHYSGYNPNKHSFLLQFILLTITTPKFDTLLIPEDKLSSLFRQEVRLRHASAEADVHSNETQKCLAQGHLSGT